MKYLFANRSINFVLFHPSRYMDEIKAKTNKATADQAVTNLATRKDVD